MTLEYRYTLNGARHHLLMNRRMWEYIEDSEIPELIRSVKCLHKFLIIII